MYGGIEGDSASMAEYIAIVSELADVPIRQDLAITGSINQLGEAQVIGGVHHKIEGFFAACQSLGPLTGTQGVVMPQQNEANLVLRDEVRDAVAARSFHLYSVARVEEAIELFTGMPAGDMDPAGDYPRESVYGRGDGAPHPLRHDAHSSPHLIHRFRGSWRAPLKINGFGRLPRLLRRKTKDAGSAQRLRPLSHQ